ncbi:MAG: acetyltransferase [Acidobacteriia bacterium]|nr:acetyltransferase [Terriglobia bacterium]
MIEVRPLTEHGDLTEAVRLQKEIWGFHDIDLLPVRLFVVATKIGGQVFGAYDGARMVGFCLSIPGLKTDGSGYLHSHMLGVTQEYRNYGAGRLLKLAQREEALLRSIHLIEWTFDPLEIKNAYFNMERLGAVVRRHVYNQYGVTTSRLNGSLPTDRLIAEWHLASERVSAIVSGAPATRPRVEQRINVPASIAQLRLSDPAQARQIQAHISDQFQLHLSSGLAVIGMERSKEAGTYLLGKWDSR